SGRHHPRRRVIQYAAAPMSALNDGRSVLGRPVKPGDDIGAHFAFRKSATSSSTNSLSSALFGSRLEENGRLLALPTMSVVSAPRLKFSMVKKGKVSTPSLSGFFAFFSGSLIFIRSI